MKLQLALVTLEAELGELAAIMTLKKKLGWMDDSSEEELAIYILCCSDEYKELTPDEVIRKVREKNLHNFMRQLS